MEASEDALSQVLRLVRLRTCIYFVKRLGSPWGIEVPITTNGPLHMVLEGQCFASCGEETVTLEAGDLIMFPRGSRHNVANTPSSLRESGQDFVRRLRNTPDDLGPDSVRMLCGHFEWDEAFDHPLFNELPDMVVVRNVVAGDGASQMQKILDLIIDASDRGEPGGSAIADRIGEVLFVSILRSWIAQQQPQSGVLATINDKRLSRALQCIHQNPEAGINLDVLARKAGMSRTSFAVRFRQVMGIPPATYLTEWRMLHARRLLLDTCLATADIIERIGYGSESAFTRAFKRRFGETPGRVRRKQESLS